MTAPKSRFLLLLFRVGIVNHKPVAARCSAPSAEWAAALCRVALFCCVPLRGRAAKERPFYQKKPKTKRPNRSLPFTQSGTAALSKP